MSAAIIKALADDRADINSTVSSTLHGEKEKCQNFLFRDNIFSECDCSNKITSWTIRNVFAQIKPHHG